jgi:hypothetical protein
VSVVRDRGKRQKLHSAISDSSRRKWSKQAEQDMAVLRISKDALVKALCDRINSGLEIEETVNQNPQSGHPETAFQMTFTLDEIPLFVKCKFFEYDCKEHLRIYSVHKDKK